jgi:hypothetical protein
MRRFSLVGCEGIDGTTAEERRAMGEEFRASLDPGRPAGDAND